MARKYVFGGDKATKPPATKPQATEPPATEPPATESPATEPPATKPIKEIKRRRELGISDLVSAINKLHADLVTVQRAVVCLNAHTARNIPAEKIASDLSSDGNLATIDFVSDVKALLR